MSQRDILYILLAVGVIWLGHEARTGYRAKAALKSCQSLRGPELGALIQWGYGAMIRGDSLDRSLGLTPLSEMPFVVAPPDRGTE